MALEKHFIQEGVIRSEVESFLRKELNRAGYSGINIQKTPLSTRVILYVEKPPLVIGKKGKRINKLTTILSEKYGVDNPSIDVQKIEEPMLDPNIIARRIAVALERGINRRRVVYRALRSVMGAKARGIEIILSGKIVGKGGRSRTEKYLQGYMKKAGNSVRLVRIGSTQAYLKAGVIGVTVKIVPPDAVFPDQIYVRDKPVEKAIEKEAGEPAAEIEGKTPENSKEKKEKAKKPAKKTTKKKPAEEKKQVKAKKEEKTAEKEKKEEKPLKKGEEKEKKIEIAASKKPELEASKGKLLAEKSESTKKESQKKTSKKKKEA
ncbi:MAG: 30S ribosomal protein S3 [Methanobacteriota archaeon]